MGLSNLWLLNSNVMTAETKTQKIIIAEDNDFVRMQVCKFLGDAGYDFDDFSSAAEASESIHNNYDLAILDVRMEPMGGFEFIKHMRSEKIETPAVLITGDEDPNLLSEASRLGVLAVLIKPVQKDRLLKAVEKTLLQAERRKA